MISKISLFLFLICLFCFCNNKATITSYDTDVQKIICANIKATIGKADSAKMAYRFPPPEAIESAAYKRYYDSIRAILDTAAVFISITDSFAQTRKSDIADIKAVQKNYTSNTEEYRLLDEMISDSLAKDQLDLKMIATDIQLPVKAIGLKNMHDIRFIAQFRFSNIVLNPARTKAVVYQSYYCSGNCGYGEIRFLEKKNNEWVVVELQRTWIS